MLRTGEEERDESCTKTGDGFVTVKRIFLQLGSDRLLYCRLEEAELCSRGIGKKTYDGRVRTGTGSISEVYRLSWDVMSSAWGYNWHW
jgi:hypothetical protein